MSLSSLAKLAPPDAAAALADAVEAGADTAAHPDPVDEQRRRYATGGHLARIVVNLVLGRSVVPPRYPVCMECKAQEAVCLFDGGEPCLGPITRGGCDAWCPTNRLGCWGCRGPSEDANVGQMIAIMRERGFSAEVILDRLQCFGGFAEYADNLRNSVKSK